MKISYLLMALNVKVSQVKNANYPACFNCAHFIKYQQLDPLIPSTPYNDQEFGLCKNFGEMNLVSGKVKYDYASFCRDDDKKCGEKGALYEEVPTPSRIENAASGNVTLANV